MRDKKCYPNSRKFRKIEKARKQPEGQHQKPVINWLDFPPVLLSKFSVLLLLLNIV